MKPAEGTNFPLLIRKGCIAFLLLMLLITGDRSVDAVGTRVPVKTIQSEDGDIIDCVDIYKQPAFDHPLLHNHTIEMRPSFIPILEEYYNSSSVEMAEQTWLKSGSCPDGTIPILRETKSTTLQNSTFSESYGPDAVEPTNCRVEVAGAVATEEAPYHGIGGILNIWNMRVLATEWSLNSIAAMRQPGGFVEAGWGVSPSLFGDSETRDYINWRDIGGKGCFNLKCPGFVQISKKFALGTKFNRVSTYNGKQYVINLKIYKDDIQRKWWLMYRDEVYGYWPTSIFSDFQFADRVEWLGRVCDTQIRNLHTSTEMGSGRWPSEGWGKASFVQKMLVRSEFAPFDAPEEWRYIASFTGCYDVKKAWRRSYNVRPGFYYGGPGGVCCDGRCHKP